MRAALREYAHTTASQGTAYLEGAPPREAPRGSTAQPRSAPDTSTPAEPRAWAISRSPQGAPQGPRSASLRGRKTPKKGRVAQLARAPRLHRGGRPFESGRAHSVGRRPFESATPIRVGHARSNRSPAAPVLRRPAHIVGACKSWEVSEDRGSRSGSSGLWRCAGRSRIRDRPPRTSATCARAPRRSPRERGPRAPRSRSGSSCPGWP